MPPLVVPAEGTTDVPLNARVIVQYEWILDTEIELRDAMTGEVVPTMQELRPAPGLQRSTVFIAPMAALAANTSYTVVVPAVGNSSITTSFTTGDAVDTSPPAFAGLSALSLETMGFPVLDEDGSYCLSSCIEANDGRISRIRFDYPDPPADAVFVEMQLYPIEQPLGVERVPVSASSPRFFGYETCSARAPRLDPDAEYCARLVAYDMAGNTAGESNEICMTALRCEPRAVESSPGLSCEPSDECVPVLPIDEEPDSGGCSTSHAASGLSGLVVLACMGQRQRRTKRRSHGTSAPA